jgi:retron-type reverse transcriptase
MYNRLSFLKHHHILTEDQHGFRENKSTETASQSFIESVQEALANQSKAIDIFLDLSKAYDVINHEILLDKLDSYGVRGTTNNWFKSYLTRRTQVVEIPFLNRENSLPDKWQSSPSEIEHGVPHGSILGPLLFLLYINDLPNHIKEAKVVLYADDTN